MGSLLTYNLKVAGRERKANRNQRRIRTAGSRGSITEQRYLIGRTHRTATYTLGTRAVSFLLQVDVYGFGQPSQTLLISTPPMGVQLDCAMRRTFGETLEKRKRQLAYLQLGAYKAEGGGHGQFEVHSGMSFMGAK